METTSRIGRVMLRVTATVMKRTMRMPATKTTHMVLRVRAAESSDDLLFRIHALDVFRGEFFERGIHAADVVFERRHCGVGVRGRLDRLLGNLLHDRLEADRVGGEVGANGAHDFFVGRTAWSFVERVEVVVQLLVFLFPLFRIVGRLSAGRRY